MTSGGLLIVVNNSFIESKKKNSLEPTYSNYLKGLSSTISLCLILDKMESSVLIFKAILRYSMLSQ